MDKPTLLDRRATAEAAIATLEREQGSACLDGGEFDFSRLTAARAELSALDAAESEAVRRERDVKAADRAQDAVTGRKRLAETLDSYIAAVGRAEASAKAMVADLQEVEALAADMRRQVHALGSIAPVSIEMHESRAKHSAMLATVLCNLGARNHFGAIRWNSMPLIPDWTAHARKFVADALQPIIKEI